MKVLLDSCVWGGAKHELIAAGHDVEAAADWPRDPGDPQVLAAAVRGGCVLITLDKDFGALVVLHGIRHHGIIRLVNISATRQAAVADAALRQYHADLTAGAIVTAEPGRFRIRGPA